MFGRFGRGQEHKSQELHPTTEEIANEMLEHLPLGPIEWGVPTRCPVCENMGYIDRLDLVDRVMQLHCPSCMYHWEISEDQIDAIKRQNQAKQLGDDRLSQSESANS